MAFVKQLCFILGVLFVGQCVANSFCPVSTSQDNSPEGNGQTSSKERKEGVQSTGPEGKGETSLKEHTEGLPKLPVSLCYIDECMKAIQAHIKEELDAAFAYTYLASYFDQDSIARPGLANFLYESASEERQHAIMMLNYLNMRGFSIKEYGFNAEKMPLYSAITYNDTLVAAIELEMKVTQKIYDIVDVCEKDFHGADFFTDPILSEQHDSIRKLQGLYQTYQDLTSGASNGQILAFAEYTFDQKLLSEKV